MKYIITKFFEKQFQKEFSNVDIQTLVSKINIHSKNFIGFKQPFFKVKLNIGNKVCRLIVSYDSQEAVILCIHIFSKKDKNIGENLSWKLHEKDILSWTGKNMDCIEKGEYYNIEL